jgi:hypothetical protein
MLYLILFSLVTGSALHGTKSYEECVKDGFKLANACAPAKVMHDLGKKAESLSSKK